MASSTKQLIVEIGAKIDKLEAGLNKAETKVSKFGNVVNKIGVLIAGAFAVSRIAAFTAECSKLAAVSEEVEAGFYRLNNAGTLKKLRDAVSGTVSDLNIMKATVKAESFGVPLKSLATYFEFAERKAGELGMTTEECINSLINGLGGKSTRALKALGISSIELQKEFGDIEPTMMSVGAVSEKVLGIITKQLKEMGEGVDSDSDKIERQAAQWDSVKVSWGKLVNSFKTTFSPVFEWAFKKIDILFRAMGMGGGVSMLGSNIQVIRAEDAALEANTEALAAKAEKENELKLALEARAAALARAAEAAKAAAEKEKIAFNSQSYTGKTPSPSDQLSPPEIYRMDPVVMGPYDSDELITGIDGVTNSLTAQAEASSIAEDAMASLMTQATEVDSLKDFANALRDTVKKIIATLVAQVVVEQVAKAAGKSTTWWGAIAAGAAAAAGTAALFEAVIPSFATGGIVKSPTLAVVGDNPSGKGEAIIPLDKLGGNSNRDKLAVRGYDLYWVRENYIKHLRS
jgi:hypothetical protein